MDPIKLLICVLFLRYVYLFMPQIKKNTIYTHLYFVIADVKFSQTVEFDFTCNDT
jgi:hypothetical protein